MKIDHTLILLSTYKYIITNIQVKLITSFCYKAVKILSKHQFIYTIALTVSTLTSLVQNPRLYR